MNGARASKKTTLRTANAAGLERSASSMRPTSASGSVAGRATVRVVSMLPGEDEAAGANRSWLLLLLSLRIRVERSRRTGAHPARKRLPFRDAHEVLYQRRLVHGAGKDRLFLDHRRRRGANAVL